MKIAFLGAAQTVTGSCFVIQTDKARFAVDCGMFQGNSAAMEHTGIVPFFIIAAEFDLETVQTICVDPVIQQNRITVIGFGTGEFFRVKQIFSADEMPDGKSLSGFDKEVFRIKSLELIVAEITCQIAVHIFCVIGFINRNAMKISVSIMQSKVKGSVASQFCQLGIFTGKLSFQKFITDFHGMTADSKLIPEDSQFPAHHPHFFQTVSE